MRPPLKRIRTGWLLDGGGAPVRADRVLALAGSQVAAVSRFEAGTPIDFDLSHCTVLPALVDAHVHLTMSGCGDPDLRRRQLEMDRPQSQAVIGRHLAQHLAHGVAAVRDGGDHCGHVLAYRHHPTAEPLHLAAAGRAWHAAGRYGRLIGRPLQGAGGLAAAIARSAAAGGQRPDHIKIVNSGLNSLKRFGAETAPQFSAAELAAAVAAAARLGLPVMVHANGREPVADALAAGCASIEHGFFMGEENLARLADGVTVWVPTAVTMAAYARQVSLGAALGGVASGADLEVVRRNRDHQLEQLRLAAERGVRVAVGTDAGSLGVDHGPAVAEEMNLLAQAGFSLPAVVQAATWNGARLMGLSDRGRLVAGQRADIVAVAGPPESLLARLAAPAALFVAGEPQAVGDE